MCKTPLGCMHNYDVVVYTEDELKIVKDIETCLGELTSEFFRGKANDMLEYFHASKRVLGFMNDFNSFTGNTSCKCDIMDLGDEPDCMPPHCPRLGSPCCFKFS
ncbi:hypothetical protein T484DRAFT_1741576 [Baffinella frigidus]|nr:hypothetical protein T484DRAFT_1741576 [Cryptophyta sp. CCMP2293]